MSLLECKNLCVGYSSKTVCENLNFCVEKGDFVFIVGENGSGKSTLMKTILRFIKPLSGSIHYSSEWNDFRNSEILSGNCLGNCAFRKSGCLGMAAFLFKKGLSESKIQS